MKRAVLLFALPAILQSATPIVGRESLCVTEGTVQQTPSGRLIVEATRMRAYVKRGDSRTVEADFKYLGSRADESKLGSGETRRQFGLKLRAHDACNLVYVMWRIDPESKLVVSIKSNPGQHSSVECGNRGYQNIKPASSSPMPVLHPGDRHTLRAEMQGETLTVYVDNGVVWSGRVPVNFDGPVGMRSDNARLELELHASGTASVTGCRSGPFEVE